MTVAETGTFYLQLKHALPLKGKGEGLMDLAFTTSLFVDARCDPGI